MVRLSTETGEAEIDEKGAYLISLSLEGKDIIKKSHDDSQTHGGSAVLIPYAGRVRNAEYAFRGVKYNLPANNGSNSIHGFLKDEEWSLINGSSSSALLSCDFTNSGYPSTLHTELEYRLESRKFSVTTHVRNTGYDGCPLLIGFHPYFLTGGKWRLSHSDTMKELVYEDRFFPNGEYREVNFNSLKNTGEHEFDNCYLGGGAITLHGEDRSVTIRRKNMPFLVIYNGKHSEGVSVAIEPMTGAPDSFNNGMGLVELEPGSEFSCGFSIELIA